MISLSFDQSHTFFQQFCQLCSKKIHLSVKIPTRTAFHSHFLALILCQNSFPKITRTDFIAAHIRLRHCPGLMSSTEVKTYRKKERIHPTHTSLWLTCLFFSSHCLFCRDHRHLSGHVLLSLPYLQLSQ